MARTLVTSGASAGIRRAPTLKERYSPNDTTNCLAFAFGGPLSHDFSLAAVRGDSVQYVGGTLSVDENTQGKLDLTGSETAVFTSKKGQFEIPFQGIKSLEYGQKSGRRVGVAVAITPLALFSKKRKHFVTLTFTDASGAEQGAVFEFGKKTVRNALNVLETRSEKTVEFESEQARKNLP